METRSEDGETTFLVLCNLLLGAIFLLAFAANVLVLVVFHRKSGLRSVANRFVVNLTVINLVSCTSLLPLSLADNSIASSDRFLCAATELSSVFCSSVIVFAVLLIALDQYFAVVDPLHYHRVISSSKSNWMIVSTWCLSAAFAVADGVQPSIDGGSYSVFRHCGVRSEANSTAPAEGHATWKPFPAGAVGIYRFSFTAVYAVSVFVVPFALICFIYYRICAAASGNTKRTRTSCVNAEESVHSCCGVKDRLDADSTASEKADFIVIVNELRKSDDVTGEQFEAFDLLGGEVDRSRDTGSTPSFVLTRPSPPRSGNPPEARTASDSGDAREKAGGAPEGTAFLKPTLKNNSSFSRLSSLHIQFSTRTEEIRDGIASKERRHSNAPIPVSDPEFDRVSISKSRSPSIQSNLVDLPGSPHRSPIASSRARSSRSPSINSNCQRHPASRASSIRSTSSYIVHNIRHRISNASLFRYREEARAARISALVVVMALACWLPLFAVFCLHSGLQLELVTGRKSFPAYLDSFSVAFLLLSTAVSPFLFAFRNRKIKKEIRKMMRFRRGNLGADCAKSFYKYNFSVDIKAQTTHLFLGLAKKPGAEYQIDTITY